MRRHPRPHQAAIICLLALCAPAFAAESTGSRVLLVVNERVHEGESVARHYARVRGVPNSNVLRIRTQKEEAITRKQFDERIRKPIEAFLKDRPDIDFIVPVYGVPLKVREHNRENDKPDPNEPKKPEPKTPEEKAKAKARAMLEKFVMRRDFAAVDSELALAGRAHPLDGWIRNPYLGVDKPISRERGIYVVVRLDGPGAPVVHRMIDDARFAETYGLTGNVYVDLNGRGKTGYNAGMPVDADFEGIYKRLTAVGYKGELDEKRGKQKDDYPGLMDFATFRDTAVYWGWYSAAVYPRKLKKKVLPFRPGSIAAHLYSGAAKSVRKENAWTAWLLARGATVSVGTVYEPLTTGWPIGGVMIHAMQKGYTFGEAGYISTQTLSWQACFCGDPLYRPWPNNWKTDQENRRKELAMSLAGSVWPRQLSGPDRYRALRDGTRIDLPDADLKRISAALARMETDARTKLDRAARAYEQKRYADAARAADRVAANYPGGPAATAAYALLSKLRKDPDARDAADLPWPVPDQSRNR